MDAQTVSNELLASMQKDFESSKPVFPTFLNVSIQIKKAIDRENFSLDMLVPLIQLEPMIATRLIGLANSAFYCRSGNTVKDIRGAVMRLGCSVVKSVAFAVATKQLAEGEELRAVRKTVTELWKHSITTATWAHTLALHAKSYSPDEALFVGMLQNIGKFYVISKAVKFTKDRELILDCAHQWHLFASARLLDALGVNVQVRSAATMLYKGTTPPTSLVEIIQCAALLSDDQNPLSLSDYEVHMFIRTALQEKLGDEYDLLMDLALSEYTKSIQVLLQ